MTTFKKLGLNSDIMKSLDDLGFEKPSPIQAEAIPFILNSKNDLTALAQTGTGKTAAFSLPILNQIKKGEKALQAIILSPTRELAIQIAEDIEKFSKYSEGLIVTPVYGGARIDTQIKAIKRGTNIVVGTPGRVHDLIRRKCLKLQDIKWLVLDEADEMLDMGFKDDLDAILGQTSKGRQTLLFSATMSRSVHAIARQYMTDAKEISAGEKNIGADKISHEYYVVQARDRFDALKRILDNLPGIYGILFCRTKRETQDIADKLRQNNYKTKALHGDVSQDIRTKIMNDFRKKNIHLLVATDVAARGIDVGELSHVINYNLPDQDKIYTHRSGRTGRADKSGVSISIVGPRDKRKIKKLEVVIGKEFECKKVPNREDIYQKQADDLLQKIENTKLEKIENKAVLEGVIKKLSKMHKEDLINYLVNYKFGQLLDAYKDARDTNVDATGSDFRGRNDDGNVNLKINIGKRDGFDVKGLFSLINSHNNLKGVDIGKIDLMPEYSTFSVDKEKAHDVIRYLSGKSFKGRKVVIRKGGNKKKYQGGRSSRNNRGGSRGVYKKRFRKKF